MVLYRGHSNQHALVRLKILGGLAQHARVAKNWVDCMIIIMLRLSTRPMNKKTVMFAAAAIFAMAAVAALATTLQPTEAEVQTGQDVTDQLAAAGDQNDNGSGQTDLQWTNVHSNVLASFNAEVVMPAIQPEAFIHPFAVVIGNCHIGKMVFVAPGAVCRGDEGMPIHVGDGSNIQDGVVIHGLETVDDGHNIDDRRFSIDGERLKGDDPAFADGYAVFVGNNTSLAHGAMVHGPAWIGHNTFVGMEALVFNAKVGNHVAVGVSATITGGVEIADGKFVPPGAVIATQEQADALPERVGSAYENINDAIVSVNLQLAEEYDLLDLERLVIEREKEMDEDMLETSMPHP